MTSLAFICDAVRTRSGRYVGALSTVPTARDCRVLVRVWVMW